MGLKTLKDMDFKGLVSTKKDDNERYTICVFDVSELKERFKQEAIKHVIELEGAMKNWNEMPDYNFPYNHLNDWKGHTLSQMHWIKHFFNILEQDLKGGIE